MKGSMRVITSLVIIFGTIGRSEIDPTFPTSTILIALSIGLMLGFSGLMSGSKETK